MRALGRRATFAAAWLLLLCVQETRGANLPPSDTRGVTVSRSLEAGVAFARWSGLRDNVRSASLADTSAASMARWRARLADPASAATALHVLATLRSAAGDSAGADSCWRALAGRAGIWQWDAMQRAAARTQAALGPRAADSLLANADREAWSDSERATWLERRARLLAAAGDAAQSAELARQLVLAYPGVGPAAGGLALLDSLAAARGDSVQLDELRMGAEIDFFRGARSSAIGALKRALARSNPAQRFAAALRLAEVSRASRMPLAARTAADTAARYAQGPDERARAQLEGARALRDAAKTDSALALYARVARGAAGSGLRATAWWEYAREAEDRGRYRDALEAFTRVSQLGDRRSDDARFQAGLMYFAAGAPDSARTWWRRAHGENATFWLAIALRPDERAASDSLLHELASLPGYGFYRAAARETLGTRGWPGEGREVASAPEASLAIEPDVRALLESGRTDDAGELLARWAAGDVRAGALHEPGAAVLMSAAALAFQAGREALGTKLAERAFSAAPGDSEAWAIVPWAYPPAWEAEVRRAATPPVEPALLWALERQESRFDPQARSRSDALGLTQLKLATAADVARAMGDPPPSERDLFEPARASRYGARYLAQMLQRFDGHVPVALAAYNAGASGIRSDWRALIARGGEALYCELASNADSQDYVRRIVGFRQAYRELAPRADAAATPR